MKNKNIIKLFAFLWSALLIVSCSNEDLDRKDGPTVPEGLPVTMKLNVGTPEVPVVETKADPDHLDNGKTFGIINNLFILVYDENGQNLELSSSKEINAISKDGISFTTKTGKRKIYVLTNVTESEAKEYDTEAKLLAKTIVSSKPTGEEMMLGCVVKGSGESAMMNSSTVYDELAKNPRNGVEAIDINSDGDFSARVIPPYSKITFEIKKELKEDDWVVLNISEVSIRNKPNIYSFVPLAEKELSKEQVISEKYVIKEKDDSYIFYMYENKQGEVENKSGNPINKNPFLDGTLPAKGNGNPSSIKYDAWESIWAKKTPCTYIEVEGEYAHVVGDDKGVAGKIHYRFFLGENTLDNFNINRNTHYKVQLVFTGIAGYNELQYEWRVQADLNEIAVIPEGQIDIDGSPNLPLPFYLINNAGGEMSVVPTKDGGYAGDPVYGGSDMKFHYNIDQSSSDLNSNIMALMSNRKLLRVGVSSNNGGILGAPGHGGFPTNIEDDYYGYDGKKGSFSYSDNYNKRTDVAAGKIYRVREYTLKSGIGSYTKPFKVKEFPLLLIAEDAKKTGNPSNKGNAYAQRVDRVNAEDKRVMTEEEAKIICPRVRPSYPGADFGVLSKAFPTLDDFKKMIEYEDEFTPKEVKYYWTDKGLYEWVGKGQAMKPAPAGTSKGYLRCVYK